MGSEHQYELRNGSRSRSHTPMILIAPTEVEQVEHNYDLRSKSRERSYTPGEVTSSRHSSTRSLPNSVTKTRDHTIETSKEQYERENSTLASRDNHSRTPDNTKSDHNNPNRRTERRSERQRIKRQIFANGQSELKDNGQIDHKLQSTTPEIAMTSDYSFEEGDRDDTSPPPTSAYEIYKQSGEWWNVFPKTDYTYAKSSQCRYEIAPGILAMPNMSRRSIHSNDSDTNNTQTQSENSCLTLSRTFDSGLDTTNNKPYKDALNQIKTKLDSGISENLSLRTNSMQYEEYKNYKEALNIRNRFSGKYSFSNSHQYHYSSPIDSDEELELVQSNSVRVSGIFKWLKSPFTFVTILLVKILEFLKLKSTQKNQHYYYNHRRYEASKVTKVWNFITRYLPFPYLLLAKVLLLDSWLLSRVSGITKHSQGRRSRILWIVLLPLILLGGFCCFSNIVSLLSKVNDANEHVSLHNKADAKTNSIDDHWEVIENLHNRLEHLETEDSSQKTKLLQIGDLLKELKEDHENFLTQYNDKITNLNNKEDKINEVFHINDIKSELASLKKIYSHLKSCCENTQVLTNEMIDQQIERSFIKYFGNKFSREDLVTVLTGLVLSQQQNGHLKSTVEENDSNPPIQVNDNYIRKIVGQMLRIYDADRTGKVDYALESAGGQIISIRCTQKYRTSRVVKLLGFTLYHESNNPRTVIQGNPIQPGACWAFQDFPGYLLIKLRCAIHVTGFTLEHAPRSILPNGEMKSAPRKFNVWGLNDENDMEPVLFGDYEFLDSEHNLQYFPVQNATIVQPFEYVELRIDNNHGQLEYTCLYRFRVHGTPL